MDAAGEFQLDPVISGLCEVVLSDDGAEIDRVAARADSESALRWRPR